MNCPSRWQLPCRAANRCGGWGQSLPARCSALWGWEPPGAGGRTRAKPSAINARSSSGLNASRPVRRATATRAASVEAAGPTPVAPRGRAVAVAIAPISPTTSTIAEAAPRVEPLLSTRLAADALGERASTGASMALSTATGGARPWIRIRTIAAPAETSAPHRPRTVTRGHAVCAAPGSRIAAVTAPTFAMTTPTAAPAETSAAYWPPTATKGPAASSNPIPPDARRVIRSAAPPALFRLGLHSAIATTFKLTPRTAAPAAVLALLANPAGAVIVCKGVGSG